jgi:hypothetical protein
VKYVLKCLNCRLYSQTKIMFLSLVRSFYRGVSQSVSQSGGDAWRHVVRQAVKEVGEQAVRQTVAAG